MGENKNVLELDLEHARKANAAAAPQDAYDQMKADLETANMKIQGTPHPPMHSNQPIAILPRTQRTGHESNPTPNPMQRWKNTYIYMTK